ncbi:MAG: undecaprenyldiphospho-muramoylpentapeptide beta-N-acetylglucosaminyltransferase [Eubacteriales bacterium]|nr:undecaprenyldiphospho-muramoylpentapeptide beta-N-acetylglucosaminyltransferase [Eubacteriales bacterium]
MKFIFTCGGTAGHINPALSIASRIRDSFPSSEILFIGAEGKMESDLVPREGFGIETVKITNISREHSLEGIRHNLHTAENVLLSVRAARKIIREFSPDVVIGTGGYVCFPVLTAAKELHIPTVIHESNAGPGLTTRLLAHSVDKILVGVEESKKEYPDPSKVIATGTPVRTEFGMYSKEIARSELGIVPEEKLVVSVWGSLGAAYMNDTVLNMLPLIKEKAPGFRLIHVTGSRYYPEFMEKAKQVCPDYAEYGIDIREYIHDMPRIMNAADLVMCRSGASTLSELTYIGKPAILVPSPNVTGNHQEKNARVLERAGAATVMLEGKFDAESLLSEICSVLSDPGRLEKMSEGAAALSYSDSSERITDIVLELASSHAI